MWNTFHLQSSRDPIIYFLFRVENPSYKTAYKPAVSEPMGLHQKIISYLHHRYCHRTKSWTKSGVNVPGYCCVSPVTIGQCVTTSVPSVLLHIHIRAAND